MIILTHHTGELHGILGAQSAATFFTRKYGIDTIVVGVTRAFSKKNLLRFIEEHYSGKDRVIGFSHLCGRKDLIELIADIKAMGYTTILGGPQALVDYLGEKDHDRDGMRFKGLNSIIDIAIQGPVQKLYFDGLNQKKGVISLKWERDIEIDVDWSNMFLFQDDLKNLLVRKAQVLNSIGCLYASKEAYVEPPIPWKVEGITEAIRVSCYGCVFCDVAKDKGYKGNIKRVNVVSQIMSLPEEEGRKIPFELIDEYPIISLPKIVEDTEKEGIKLSRIDLVCRVDDIIRHKEALHEILKKFKDTGITLCFSSIGFESFNDRILRYLNKGITVHDIITCVQILRALKDKFGETLRYRTDEGANHGFIHPTPWDDDDTEWENKTNIAMHRLFDDILPYHSVPLIIHHSSFLGDWIRMIESRSKIKFKRDGTWIEWWNIYENH
ncbi:MAG: hypothetical protein N2745_00200 [Syntrophorhabdaceae bacterium]|nr:hypothetical protein [Syntrophorhabdaceae bacterium]